MQNTAQTQGAFAVGKEQQDVQNAGGVIGNGGHFDDSGRDSRLDSFDLSMPASVAY